MAEKLKPPPVTGIHPEVLKSLIAKCDGMKADMDEARGELGAAVKDAEEVHGINRKAFKLVLSLKRMEQDKRDDFLRSLTDYVAKLDLGPQADLFDEGDEAARRAGQDAKAEGEAQVAENKARLKGIKKLGDTTDGAVH